MDDEIKAGLRERFADNLARVGDILEVYDQVSGRKPGRPSVQESDVLRAAVVLLHATLEDLLRSIAAWKYPTARPEVLAQVPLAGKKGQSRPTHSLEDLVRFRGESVAFVIETSVTSWLERSNFNNIGDVKRLFDDLHLPITLSSSRWVGDLAAMMSRRHLIAHRLDRNEFSGRGQHQAQSLAKALVERWFQSVSDLGASIFSAMEPS